MDKIPSDKKESNKVFVDLGEQYIEAYKAYELLRYQEDKEKVWAKIKADVNHANKKKSSAKIFYALSIAACFLLLLGGFYLLIGRIDSDNDKKILDITSIPLPDHHSDEIVMITSSNKTLNIEDNSYISYQQDGSVRINSQKIANLSSDDKKNEKQSFNQIVVPKGKRTQVCFADGTIIHINSGSRVVYPSVFLKDKRVIYVDGEAFLNVKKDSLRPFIVSTDKMNIQVLGTSFNVCAYKADNECSVVLVSGKVEVETKTKQKIGLSPDDMLSLTDSSVTTKKVNVSNYISWTQGIMTLNAEPLDRVLSRLSRYYGEKIIYDTILSTVPISGKLDLRDELKDVINIIAETAPVNISRNEDIIYVEKKK